MKLSIESRWQGYAVIDSDRQGSRAYWFLAFFHTMKEAEGFVRHCEMIGQPSDAQEYRESERMLEALG